MVIVAESSRTSPRQEQSASAAWPSAIESSVAPFFLSLRYALYGSTVGPQPIPEPISVVESTPLNSTHRTSSYAVCCVKKKSNRAHATGGQSCRLNMSELQA